MGILQISPDLENPKDSCIGLYFEIILFLAKFVCMHFSGKSKTHCMKNLALVTPSGIAFFFGPEIGSKHDSGISNKHLVPQQVEQVFGSYRVYADQGKVTLAD